MYTFRYIRKVYAFDPRAENCAYNINYLYPSGGSLPHPHAQVYLDHHPTTLMRLQREASIAYWTAQGRSYWEDLAETEEARGLRFVARVGRTRWITAFAPIGFNEVMAVVPDCETILPPHGRRSEFTFGGYLTGPAVVRIDQVQQL
jgi:UDPglucose--hexose-1-phosphate uridylyltransferase